MKSWSARQSGWRSDGNRHGRMICKGGSCLGGDAPLLYLALGDSITHGYEASVLAHRYVDRVAERLCDIAPTHVHICAKPGWTANQLHRAVDRLSTCFTHEADLVTLMIGGNDMLKLAPWFLDESGQGRERMRERVLPEVDAIMRAIPGDPASVRVLCTLYNPFPAWPVAVRAVTEWNALLTDLGRRRGWTVASIDGCFRGCESELIKGYRRGDVRDFRLVKNPIHPNDAGHQVLANAVVDACAQAIKQRFAPSTASLPPTMRNRPAVRRKRSGRPPAHGRRQRMDSGV